MSDENNLFGLKPLPSSKAKKKKKRISALPPALPAKKEAQPIENRDPSKLYFVHKQYRGSDTCQPLVFEYVGPIFYMDGRKVEDFVSVRCINDLGMRAYLAGAYTVVGKRFLAPYKTGALPDPNWRPSTIPAPQPLAPVDRINKTTINTKRGI